MATFSIWEGDECGIALQHGTAQPRIDADAVMVDSFEAATWEEACQKLNDRYGWGPYQAPECGWEPIQDKLT